MKCYSFVPFFFILQCVYQCSMLLFKKNVYCYSLIWRYFGGRCRIDGLGCKPTNTPESE